jgi:hypothetical protein
MIAPASARNRGCIVMDMRVPSDEPMARNRPYLPDAHTLDKAQARQEPQPRSPVASDVLMVFGRF